MKDVKKILSKIPYSWYWVAFKIHSILSFKFLPMSIPTRIIAAVIGWFHGEQEKQKFLHTRQAKKEERKLKNFLSGKWPYYAD